MYAGPSALFRAPLGETGDAAGKRRFTPVRIELIAVFRCLTKAFHALQVASPRNAVHLTSGQHSLVVGKDDYSNMAEHIISKVNDDTTQVNTFETKLKIRKLDFIGDTMWSFVDENNKNITATIEDENFSRRVKTGEIKLSANDVLFVRLRIEAPIDKYMNVGRKKFYIEAVLKYDTPIQAEQLTIPLPD